MRYPGALWRGPVPNQTAGAMTEHRGVVLHVMEGTLDGTDAWFRNPAAQASSHFGVGRDGRVLQWVDTDDKAWAQAAGNPSWISIEHEGHSGDSLTDAQLEATAGIVAWAHRIYHYPLIVADDPGGTGIGWHGMGGGAWGGHLSCPGEPIKAQRMRIIELAEPAVAPAPLPKGARVYDPALHLEPIVADLACPSGGAWLAAASGAIYALGGAPFTGAPNGRPYFAGRTLHHLELDVSGRPVVIATSGERYGPEF